MLRGGVGGRERDSESLRVWVKGEDRKCRASDGKPGCFSSRLTTVPGVYPSHPSPSLRRSVAASLNCSIAATIAASLISLGRVRAPSRVRDAADGRQSSERIVSVISARSQRVKSASGQQSAIGLFFLVYTLLWFPSNYTGCSRWTEADSARFAENYRQEQIHANLAWGNIARNRSPNYSWEISSTFLNYLSPTGAEGFP